MSNYDKLRLAKDLLLEVSENWDEKMVDSYEACMSFDELVAEVWAVELKPTK